MLIGNIGQNRILKLSRDLQRESEKKPCGLRFSDIFFRNGWEF